MRNLPTLIYGAPAETDAGDAAASEQPIPMLGDECPVCLSEFAAGDELRVLPCRHCFHVKCVDEWLLDKGRAPAESSTALRGLPTCPMCKTVSVALVPQDVESGAPAASTPAQHEC